MTRLVIDTQSAPAWEPGASVEVRLIAPDMEHTVTGTLVAGGPTEFGDSTPTQHRSDTRGPCLACRHRAARSPADPSPEPHRDRAIEAERALNRLVPLLPSTARVHEDYRIIHAALTAATPTAGAGGLDVERLARAIRAESVWKDDDAFIEVWHDEAVAIAAEYAALAPVAHRPTSAEPGEAT